ncbi:MAG TPA: crossover junction endodeoxyribonuclease RuvC [Verrucomicrobiae bacterium]|nr:crossover junction endodeoxyribonuclease RuvC [Verrucomicrobiae bacterium]
MLVLGLDPGLALTGFALVDGRAGSLRLVRAGVVVTAAGDEEARRLCQVVEAVRQVVRTPAIDAVAVERLYFSRNVRTAIQVAQARGVILFAVAEAGLPIAEYTPSEVKRSVSGNGSAPKRQVARMVISLLGGAPVAGPDDVTDACAVAICHHHAQGMRQAVRRARAGPPGVPA